MVIVFGEREESKHNWSVAYLLVVLLINLIFYAVFRL